MATSIQELRSRASKLRLGQKEIAERAGLDKSTVGRLFNPGGIGSTLSTFQKVEAVIIAEEATMLASIKAAQ